MTRLCTSAVVDKRSGLLLLNGEEFPFYLVDDVTIEGLARDELTTLRLGVFVDGVAVLLEHDGRRRVIDPRLGDVGEWARNEVRARFAEAFPWLQLPAEVTR